MLSAEHIRVAIRLRAAQLSIVAAILLTGCNNGGLDLVGVEGVVKYDGTPLPGASVMFVPTQGLPAMAITDENGAFTLKTANQEGALVGEYNVTVTKVKRIEIPQKYGFSEYRKEYLVPQKYSKPTTSGLTATVSDDGDHHEFNLTSS